MQSTSWHSLRVTAAGLIVLGEWPDLDRVTSAAGIHGLLNALADGAPEEARSALRRTAGTVSRTAVDVITRTVTALARDVGRGAADE